MLRHVVDQAHDVAPAVFNHQAGAHLDHLADQVKVPWVGSRVAWPYSQCFSKLVFAKMISGAGYPRQYFPGKICVVTPLTLNAADSFVVGSCLLLLPLGQASESGTYVVGRQLVENQVYVKFS
jgi:hypothetical protein